MRKPGQRVTGCPGFSQAARWTLLPLHEATVRPAYPCHAGGVAEAQDSATGGHVRAWREVSYLADLDAWHDDAKWFGVGVAVSFGAAVPAEFGLVDGLCTGVLHVRVRGGVGALEFTQS